MIRLIVLVQLLACCGAILDQIEEQLRLAGTFESPNYDSDGYDCLPFDYVIVGAGTAGSVLANRLSERAHVKVLLLEAGGDPPRISKVPFFTQTLQRTSYDWNYTVEPQDNFALGMVGRRVLLLPAIRVGGDGLLYEVINGVFERFDWSEAIKHICFGVIPGGSGNGLARSIAYSCGEPYNPPSLPSALAAVRDHKEMMDLVRVETKSQIMFSFLSIGWGILSDIDIESEILRRLGEPRYTLWSMARLISLRSYNGKVYYLPADVTLTPMNDCKIPSFNFGNGGDLPTELHLETNNGRQRLDSWYSAASRRSTYFSTTGSSYQSTTDNDRDYPEERRVYGPASQLPCLTTTLPSSWKCMSGRFIMVQAAYQTHLGSELFMSPESKLNDGLIWLIIVHANASRFQLLQFLLGLATGSHANANVWDGVIEMLAVRAFRIEPDMSEHGYLTVDGECVEYGPIQAEVFPSLVKVMVP